MTKQERISNLKTLGYTEREPEFLCLAALHGGYFVRRQFLYFIDKCRGQIAAAFVEKTIQSGHTKANAFRGDRILYHIASKVIYEALDEADNRNRRQQEIYTIKNRLTEREKTAFFCEELATRMIAYFQDRDAYEKKDFKRFNQQRLIQFREDRGVFASPDHQLLSSNGSSPEIRHDCALLPERQGETSNVGEFGTYLLRFNYELFGTLLNGKAKTKACGR